MPIQDPHELARWQGGVDANMAAVRDAVAKVAEAVEASRAEGRERSHQVRDSLQTMVLTHAETRRDVAALVGDLREHKEQVAAQHREFRSDLEDLEKQVAPWTWSKRIGASLVGGVLLAMTFAEKIGAFIKALR